MLLKLKTTYRRFPVKFWILVLAVFIDMIGGTLLNPFFALYITSKFHVGMTEAGVLLGMMSFSGLIGNIIGGVLTDKFGRRQMILFGLVFSALSALSLGFVKSLGVMYPIIIIVGLLSNIAGPAHAAMIADMLPEEKRNEGFGIMRVAANLSWIIGPTIGGFVASRSFLMLFILDAIFSSITAVIVFKKIPETMPEKTKTQQTESVLQTVLGYRIVLKDFLFVAYLLISMLMLVVYIQMYNTLSVYMRDVHQFQTQQYGYMLSASAVLVVLTQIWVTQKTSPHPPFLMMALGSAVYMIGFTMIGFITPFYLFIVAVLVITVGEMIVSPISQALAAKFAPEDMRGRYMAVYSVAWSLPSSIGPWAAGMIMDNYNPNWVWYAGGIILAVATIGFYGLHLKLHNLPRFAPVKPQENAMETAVVSPGE